MRESGEYICIISFSIKCYIFLFNSSLKKKHTMSNYIIETQQLCYAYTKQTQDIKNLSLKVPKGSIYGFLGPNGSGKSTTIRLLLSLLKVQSGSVTIFDKNMAENRLNCLNKIGALIENPSLYGHLNALDHLKLIANYKNLSVSTGQLEEFLALVKLDKEKKKKTAAFSMGMKQRLGVAMALIGEPELLILDEPINGLDPNGIIEMRQLIKRLNVEAGVTVFISSHILSEIEKICTHLGVLSSGQLVFQGTINSFKKLTHNNVNIDIETSNDNKAIHLLNSIDISTTVNESNGISIKLTDRLQTSIVIDVLRKEKIDIYQIVNRDTMESLFIKLTEN